MVVNGKERKATATVNNGFGAGWFWRLIQPPVTPILNVQFFLDMKNCLIDEDGRASFFGSS